jgi:Rrf2 family iron-sulfur cluster assembly transcriptional regulator
VPRNYLSKTLHVLAREGVPTSTRGPHGGFRLARPPAELSLESVIQHFDDITTASGCLLGRARCSDDSPCAPHAQWKSISAALRGFLRETTIGDFAASGARVTTGPSGG